MSSSSFNSDCPNSPSTTASTCFSLSKRYGSDSSPKSFEKFPMISVPQGSMSATPSFSPSKTSWSFPIWAPVNISTVKFPPVCSSMYSFILFTATASKWLSATPTLTFMVTFWPDCVPVSAGALWDASPFGACDAVCPPVPPHAVNNILPANNAANILFFIFKYSFS